MNNQEIQEVPLSSLRLRAGVESFLAANGLRLEEVDLYLAVYDTDGRIVAGGGLKGDTLKCIAVSPQARSEGLSIPLISRLIAEASARGHNSQKLFTKPENEDMFSSLGFRTLGRAPEAILMETGRGLERYLNYLRSKKKEGKSGVIIMNANPFTLGHKYLLEQAVKKVDNLYAIAVKEDASRFPYAERLQMIREGAAGAEVLEGSSYQISASTFPSYFLKDLTTASRTQMHLDLDIFCRHIAPALGASVRFVGSEPSDPLTESYNALMAEMLPSSGISLTEIPRLCDASGPISASRVRSALDAGSYRTAATLTPCSSHASLLADLAARALKMELDAPLKPGLVCPGSTGAHSDMSYALMLKSIEAIRLSLVRNFCKPAVEFGKAVEADALAATGGVNAHRGAIFCLGLAMKAEGDASGIAALAAGVPRQEGSHGGKAVSEYGVRGALDMARGGYSDLFSDWLPFYRSVKNEEYGVQKTLLRIMSSLDDTCIIHRSSPGRLREVKREASDLLNNFTENGLRALDERFCTERLSPGGSADMLSLTIYIDSLLTY